MKINFFLDLCKLKGKKLESNSVKKSERTIKNEINEEFYDFKTFRDFSNKNSPRRK
jgi:hypothetical protein